MFPANNVGLFRCHVSRSFVFYTWLYLQRPVAKVENNGFGGSEPLLQVNISIPRIVGVFGKFHMASLENERNKIKIKKEYYGYMVTEVTMNIQKHGQLIR